MVSRILQSFGVAPWSAVVGILVLALASASLVLGGLAQAQDGPIEHDENDDSPVATYTARDPEGTAITSWNVTGTDAASFTIEDGVLRFADTPNYEMPTDVAGTSPSTAPADDNMYEITVEATDSTGQTAMKDVMVEVVNLDEDGTVALSARGPKVGVAFTATLTDPDETPGNPATSITWQWAKSSTKDGTYTDIEGAESATYMPTDASGKSDVGHYLQATASYTDPQGADKSAMMMSETKVQALRGSNAPPKFDAVQDPDGADNAAKAIAKRMVAENTSEGMNIGAPVVATDTDTSDALTYTLWDQNGTSQTGDSASFEIDWATGQIMTKGDLDHEAKSEYVVMVRATDPAGMPGASTREAANSGQVQVNITVTDLNEPPKFTEASAGTAHSVDENANLTSDNVYAAADEDVGDTDAPTWSLTGPDATKFNIATTGATIGTLTFKTAPNFEMPADADRNNVYEVTVVATSAGKAGTRMVKVTVENVDETGSVTLSRVQPTEGIPIEAKLKDLDGNISGLTWQWSKGGSDIEGATSDTYTPVADDVGEIVTVTAMYFDGHSDPDATTKKKATVEPDPPAVARDTRNKAPVFADQDMDTDGVQNTMATRKVEENTKALAGNDDDDAAEDDAEDPADNVGAALTATDLKADGSPETLIYSLEGPDAASFRVRQNGQIEVEAGTMLDFETKRTYMVTVIAADPFDESSSIDVTIMVTDLNEAPKITGDDSHMHPENDDGPVATYRARDPEGTAITSWKVTGTDAAAFMIEDGVLSFADTPNYEMPTDVAGTSPSTAPADDNMYEITVEATDSTGQTAMKDVMVEVVNLDEDGTVALSARGPKVGVAFTATLTDPDETPGNPATSITWQWAKSSTKDGTYTDIEGAESATYMPTDASGKSDVGHYLQATASYTDPQGADKSAMMMSETKVQALRGSNAPPKFDAVQDPDGADNAAKAIAKRMVAENTSEGMNIGAPVVATDTDTSDALTYTLWDQNGTSQTGDSASFEIDWATGQIMTKGDLDHEAKSEYVVMVRATDPAGMPGASTREAANSGQVQVNITVTDLNEPPKFTEASAGTAHSVDENANLTSDNVYAAADEDVGDTDAPTWSLTGPDATKFNIATTGATIGTLTFKTAPNFEMPADADRNNVYEVTVVATSAGKAGTRMVKVTVENVDETGSVTLSRVQPTEGIPIEAKLKDLDGNISGLTWQWSKGGSDIEGATSDTYTPVADDVGEIVTVTAMYFDGHSDPDATTKKKATVEPDPPAVARDTRNKAPVFADQDMDTDGVQNTMATRKVEENTKALAGNDDDDAAEDDAEDPADNVGAALTATDPKADGSPETLIYSLEGPDAASFRVRQNGQIEVEAGTMLDFETKRTYMVTVIAADPFDESSSIDVTIMVTDLDEAPKITEGEVVNQPPTFPSAIANRSVPENTAAGENIGSPVEATDGDDDPLTYELSGADRADFDIDRGTGQLKTKSPLDYETGRRYTVTVTARDGNGGHDDVTVNITVTDVDETQQTLLDRYDEDESGTIDLEEAFQAVDDYFDSLITLDEVFAVIDLYFDAGS